MPRPKRVASIHSFRLLDEDEALFQAWLESHNQGGVLSESQVLRAHFSAVLREVEE